MARSAGKVLWKLGKASVTGGIEEVVIYIIKKTMEQIASELNEKYDIESKLATWSEKVVSRATSRLNLHLPLLQPITS